MGMIEFMETLAALDDKKVSVVTFSEENGKEVEKKVEITPLQFFESFLEMLPPFVEFGERFGGLKVTGSGVEVVDPAEMDRLRKAMGMKAEGGDK